VVLRDLNRAVSQNPLDDGVVDSKAVQVRREPSTKAMPAMPGDSRTLQHIFHVALVAGIQIKGFPAEFAKIGPFAGIPQFFR
jgi:hypothetical protein